MEAADILLRSQEPVDDAHFKAWEIAQAEAAVKGMAEINAPEPNYKSAETIIAYALENLLKGLIIAKEPSLISEKKLAKALDSHDLRKLAAVATISLSPDEDRILGVLTAVSTWSGRYPVARTFNEHARDEYREGLNRLDHDVLREFYARVRATLLPLLKYIPSKTGGVVVADLTNIPDMEDDDDAHSLS